MITITFIAVIIILIGNGVLASLYNKLFPVSTKKIKYILMIPPMAMLLWVSITLVMMYMSIQDGLVKYFKEGDE